MLKLLIEGRWRKTCKITQNAALFKKTFICEKHLFHTKKITSVFSPGQLISECPLLQPKKKNKKKKKNMT